MNWPGLLPKMLVIRNFRVISEFQQIQPKSHSSGETSLVNHSDREARVFDGMPTAFTRNIEKILIIKDRLD